MTGGRGFYRATSTIIVCAYCAWRIGNTAIQGIIGASLGTLHATIELRYREIGGTVVIILR